MDIVLSFINHSDEDDPRIVIFQKTTEPSFDDMVIAWKVIEYCGRNDSRRIPFPMTNFVSASDSYGNATSKEAAYPGQAFAVVSTPSGNQLKLSGEATNPEAIEVRNDLDRGAIDGNVYKDGRLLAARTNIAPGQKALFAFEPTLWIGPAEQVQEGERMSQSILNGVNTELGLLGIARADIEMTGGGGKPLVFELKNVEPAK